MQRTVSVFWDASTPPTLFWRLSDQREFQSSSVGRSSDGWYHFDLEGGSDQVIACYLSGGEMRLPEVGHYKFRTRHAFLRNGEVFHYMPAPCAWARRHTPTETAWGERTVQALRFLFGERGRMGGVGESLAS